jgi:MFS family permease
MIGRAAPSGVSPSTMAVLMLSVFTVSLGYGVVLPLLPYLIERLLGAGGDATQVSRSTGLLTGLYTVSIFFLAPVWGRLSDRYSRRRILLIGLVGFSATMLTFATIENLVSVYSERLLSGVFAAAVTPVSLATIGDLATTETARARRLTFVSLAGISGFLLGPMFGVLISHGIPGVLPAVGVARALNLPLAMTGGLALVVAAGVALTVPGQLQDRPISQRLQNIPGVSVWLVPKLLALAFIVSAGVGVFEVGLALRGKQELGLTQYQIALMFTECSVVMIVVQALVFSPLVKPETTRWFIAPALGFMAAGLFLVPRASDFVLMLLVIGAVAASAGILSPILTYWISTKAGKAQGTELGKQTAAASLGAAMGSAVGGILFDVSWLAGASFLLAAALTVLGVLLSLGLPSLLVARKVGKDDDNAGARVAEKNSNLGQRSGPLAVQPIASAGSHHITVIGQSESRRTSMAGSRTKHTRAASIFALVRPRNLFLSSRGSTNLSTYEDRAEAKWL